MRKGLIYLSLGIAGLLAAGSADALTIPNPAPAAFGPDVGGIGRYTPSATLISVEVLDTGATLGFTGSEFGFYFANNPGTLIPIFQTSDQNPDPGGPGDTPQTAFIDMTAGNVFDGDQGVLQNTFTPGSGPIGFYLTPDPVLQSVFGVTSIFTEPGLNPGGEDMAAAFPILDPSVTNGLLFGFGAIDPSTGSLTTLGYDAAIGVTIPEPGTLALLGVGLLGLVARRRRERQ